MISTRPMPHFCVSLPSRGAWIEIPLVVLSVEVKVVAPLAGSVDRNYPRGRAGRDCIHRSLPSRGAWIEIISAERMRAPIVVAPLAGSVDRNGFVAWCVCYDAVAPLAGSVDRNHASGLICAVVVWSLPSRGAWIEIVVNCFPHQRISVAPLAGSVDRNAEAGCQEK